MKPLKRWQGILVLILVFLAGGVAGSLLTDYTGKRALARAFDFDRWPDGMLRGLKREMTLTQDQEGRLRVIGERMAERMKSTLKTAVADSGQIIVETQREIDAVLDEQQQAIHARMKEKFRKGLKEGLGVTLPEG
ncbi:MAG TPA: hypothetical protein DCY13_19345 [Verrucomicrobiales bacterium]|nr:hypothetical protein [Verrucomicrobiales bacterium]